MLCNLLSVIWNFCCGAGNTEATTYDNKDTSSTRPLISDHVAPAPDSASGDVTSRDTEHPPRQKKYLSSTSDLVKLPPSKAQILEAWENGAEPWQSTYSERLEDEKDFYSVCVYDTNPPDDEWRWNGRLDFSLHADPDFIPPWCTVWTKEQEDDLLKKESDAEWEVREQKRLRQERRDRLL
ncbi:WWE domain-containing protein [Caenorhabditis elegans]|uniref:WWE domain-containing protein n=1 Tax=Caenorhabditis elegans TaxID=6239 RepID=O02210_CAEEL|nr:WWE domain-containing protein [Caenorhabditis elegans]CAB02701.3 WWE domain-containing protein [Caenorhabditis elegans]